MVSAGERFVGLERTEAIVLRGVDFSETSRIVTFLTPERGRLACMAKGLRRPKSELAAVLDTFHRVELVFHWKDSRSVHPLQEVSLLDGYPGLRRDLSKSGYAALPLEVALRAVHEDEPAEAAYGALRNGLEAMNASTGEAAEPAARMLFRLLGALGFEPRTDGAGRGFSFLTGMIEGGERAEVRLSEAARGDLQKLAARADDAGPLEAPRELFAVLARYAEHQLATTLRSRRVIEQLFG